MKKLLWLLLPLTLLFVLAGCHKQTKTAVFDLPDGLDPNKQYEITFWAKNDTNKVQVSIYQKAVADFEALYPNIKVTVRYYTDYATIYQDVITNIATKTTPNVCVSYPDHIATYLTGENIVVPLESLMTDQRYGLGGSEVKFDAPKMEEIVPEFLEECKVNGVYYALPFMRSTEACYVNADFVEALGYELPEKLTWDFIWEVSEAAMEKNEDGTFKLNGQKVLIPFIYKSTDNMMIQMLKQKNAGYSTQYGEIQIFNDTTTELLFDLAEHVKKNVFSTFKISSYPGNFLNAGQCIFAIDSTAGATWMGSDAPLSDIHESDIRPFNCAVMEIPQFDTENPKMISQGPSVCLFNKDDPEEVLASWLFTQFLLTNEVQANYSRTEGYVPVTLKAQQDPSYLDYLSREGEDNDTYYAVKIQAAKILLRNAENTFVTPVFNGSAALRNAAGDLIENVTKSIRRKQTVDDAYIEKLYNDMTALYRLDQLQTDSKDQKRDFKSLPAGAAALLIGLGAAWLVIGTVFLIRTVREKKKKTV
ncbi:MAG: extracellular solute-binding protein [Lachnospiraceae bacterium]|nr:extracellular solute-binding protein [Lachnospiraceae bacterium]MBR5739104.1 extracellular solute-binding protein [Lachnospiraceae bacterium]